MDSVLLFDEEHIINSEEQSRPAEEERDGWGGHDIIWCDTTFRRVRLFKTEAQVERNRTTRADRMESVPLYLLVENTVSWVGEDPRYSSTKQRKRTYTTGPDSRRIRDAIKIADGYGGEVNR